MVRTAQRQRTLFFLGSLSNNIQITTSFSNKYWKRTSCWPCRSARERTTSTKACVPRRYNTYCSSSQSHWVEGLECTPITIQLPVVGNVTILEATAQGQNILVDLALGEDQVESGESDDSDKIPNHVTLSSGDPYGAVLWPSAFTMASHLLENRERLLVNKTLLEVGTGTGLVALAAALGGARRVIATDYEEIPLRLLQYASQHLNRKTTLNNDVPLVERLETCLFDICQSDDETPFPVEMGPDVVLVAADIMYEPPTGRCMADCAVQALRAGSQVLVADSPGRAGRPAFLERLRQNVHRVADDSGNDKNQKNSDLDGASFLDFVDVQGWTVSGHRHELICGATSETRTEAPTSLTVALLELDPAIHRPKPQNANAR